MRKISHAFLILLTLAVPAIAQLRAIPSVLRLSDSDFFDVTGAPPGFRIDQVTVQTRTANLLQVSVRAIESLSSTSFRVRIEFQSSSGSANAGLTSAIATVRVVGVANPVSVAILFDKSAAERFQLTSGGAGQVTISHTIGTPPPVIPIAVDYIPIDPSQRFPPVRLVVTTPSNIAWLRVNPVSLNNAGTVQATVDDLAAMSLPTGPALAIVSLENETGAFIVEANIAPRPPNTPIFNLSRRTVQIPYVLGAPVPAPEIVTITGAAFFSIFQTSGTDWLRVTPTEGATPGEIELTLRNPLTEFRTYEATLIVNAQGMTTGGETITVRVTPERPLSQTNAVMSQIATGGPWKTTLILVNTSDTASTFELRLRDDNGAAWPVSLLRRGPSPADLGAVSGISGVIGPGAMFTYQTREQPAAQIQSGYAELVLGAGVKGQAIFQQASPGGFDYEAAVPMSFGTRRFFVPFDNSSATTSIALVNQGVAANVTARIRNEQGSLLDTRTVNLAAGQHRATELVQLLGNAVTAGTGRGTIEFDSGGPDIAALGLRFRGRAFTSFPAVSSAAQPGGANPVMAQIAAGADWKTTILLVNTTDAPQSFTLRFRQAQVANWVLALQRVGPQPADLGAVATLTATIPPYGVYTYQTREMPAVPVVQGFAELTSGSGIRGQAIFQQGLTAGSSFEAAVPMERASTRFLVPYDNVTADGRPTVTSMAIANPGAAAAVMQMTVRDDQGRTLGSFPTSLPPGEHRAGRMVELVGDSVQEKRGTVEFSIVGSDVNALGLRFRGPFTSFAVIPK